MKIKIFLKLLLILLISGCSNITEKDPAASYAALTDSNRKLVFLDNEFNIVHEMKDEGFFNNFYVDHSRDVFYTIIEDSKEGPKIQIIQLSNKKIHREIPLPYLPSESFISNEKAYISSSESHQNGMPFLIVNLNTGNIEFETYTKGMVGSIKEYDNQIYFTINVGGQFGDYSNLYRLDQSNPSPFIPIIKEKIELPPGDFIIEGDRLYTTFTGFSYGPKPDWVKEPENYTNQFIVFDRNTGKMLEKKKLTKNFPQTMILSGNDIYINHYTDLDMKGDTVTILNKNTLKETLFSIDTPSYFTYNTAQNEFLFSSSPTGKITLVKNHEVMVEKDIGELNGVVKFLNTEQQ